MPDSDSEFNILPKSGELEPLGREGKNFIVSFTPVEYGKPKKGKLIIETDELYWYLFLLNYQGLSLLKALFLSTSLPMSIVVLQIIT